MEGSPLKPMPSDDKRLVPKNQPKTDWAAVRKDYLALCQTKPIKPSEYCLLNGLVYNSARAHLRIPEELREKMKQMRKEDKKYEKKSNYFMLDNTITGPSVSKLYSERYKLTEKETRQVATMSLDDELFRLKASNFLEAEHLEELKERYKQETDFNVREKLIDKIRKTEKLMLTNSGEWSRIELTKQNIIKQQLQNMKLKDEKEFERRNNDAELRRRALVNEQMTVQIGILKQGYGIENKNTPASGMTIENQSELPKTGFEVED